MFYSYAAQLQQEAVMSPLSIWALHIEKLPVLLKQQFVRDNKKSAVASLD